MTEQNRSKILKKLKNANSKTDFRATIAEIEFGKLFSKLGFTTDFEYKFNNGQTPDLKVLIGNSTTICEVYRLGKSNEDQKKSDFEDELINRLETLQFDVELQLYFINEYFNIEDYDINIIEKEVLNWLNTSKKNIGETVIVAGNFEFEIVKTNTEIINFPPSAVSPLPFSAKYVIIIYLQYEIKNRIHQYLFHNN